MADKAGKKQQWSEEDNVDYNRAEITHLRRHKRQPYITASLTFTLLVEGGVAATDAAIIVIAGASLVNAAF